MTDSERGESNLDNEWMEFVNRARDELDSHIMTPEWLVFVREAKVAIAKLLAQTTVWEYSASHPKTLAEMGEDWRQIRQTYGKGMSIQEAADQSQIWWGKLILFEEGFLDPRDEDPDFLDRLAEAYGDPNLALMHKILYSPGGDQEMRRLFDDDTEGQK